MHVDIGDARLFVHEHGAGEPIVMVPPGPGLDGSVFFPWFHRLKGYRLLGVDLPGHGRSDRGVPERWTVSDWASDLTRLADALALEGFTLLGHSFGARVALQHAVDFPGRATRVICSGGIAHRGALAHMEDTFESWGTPELRARVDAAFEAEDVVETPADCHAAWMGQMPFLLAEAGGPAAVAIDQGWRSARYSPEIHRHGSFGDFDVRLSLPEVAVPALVVTGRDDRITRPQESEEIAGLLPQSTLAIIEGAGHFPFVERPNDYFTVLEQWLART